MDRRLFFFGAAAALASSAVADNPFVAGPGCESHPFVSNRPAKVTQLPLVKEKRRHAIIEFYSIANCAPCRRWKQVMLPQCVASGWNVRSLPNTSGHPSPYFVIWHKNKRYTHTGYMSGDDMRRILGIKKPVVTQPTSKPIIRQSCPGGQCPAPPNIRGYRAKWTYPGTLKNHLSGKPHFMDVSGWTLDQMEYAHDQHHEMMRRSIGYVPYA